MRDKFLGETCAFLRSKKGLYLGYGSPTWGEKPRGEISFYFPDFFLREEKPWLNFSQGERLSQIELDPPREIRRNFTFPDPQHFFALLNGWQETGLKKVVPYLQVFGEKLSSEERAQLLMNLLSTDQTVYAFWSGDEGMVGATPELLFSRSIAYPLRLETMALAGTRGGQVSKEAFLSDPKELKEHAFVVRGIEEAFDGLGEVTKGALQLFQAGSLEHLMTPLEIHLKSDLSFDRLIKLFHPTAALGAYPKELGRSWLLAYDSAIPRGRFGAPVGVWFEGEESVFVAIRQLQWDFEKMWLTAGAGVTESSSFQKEFEEICRKLNATWKLMSSML